MYISHSVPKHYKLAMHIFGQMAIAKSLAELDELVLSCTVLFNSPCSSDNVDKHFNNIQCMLTDADVELTVEEGKVVVEDPEVCPISKRRTITR